MSENLGTDHNDHGATSILNAVDVHIALTAIEDAVNKLALLDDLAPDLATHRDELTLYVGTEISRIITKQRALEDQLIKVIDNRNALLQNNSTRAVIQASNAEVTEISTAIKAATRELCRNLRENPSVSENLRKTQAHRSYVHKLLTTAYAELKQKHSYTDLDRTVSEAHMVLIEEKRLEERAQKAKNAVRELQEEIDKTRSEHQKTLTEQQENLRELREELAAQRTRITDTVRLYQRELVAANNEADRLRTGELRKGQNLLNDIAAILQQEEASHEILHQTLQEDGQQMTKAAGDWLLKSEEVIGRLENEIAHLEQLKKQNSEKIFEMERQDEENMEEKKRWEEEEAFKQRMHDTLFDARNMRLEVTRKYLQDTWRLALDPPDPEKKKKKGGKGKKGSKGKKGK